MMNIDEEIILRKLSEIFKDIFLMDVIELHGGIGQKDIPGWDSFNHINLVMAVEVEFGIKISIQKIQELKTVENFVQEIRAHFT